MVVIGRSSVGKHALVEEEIKRRSSSTFVSSDLSYDLHLFIELPLLEPEYVHILASSGVHLRTQFIR